MIKWSVSSRWQSSLYCLIRNMSQMAIGKGYLTLAHRSSLTFKCFHDLYNFQSLIERLITTTSTRLKKGAISKRLGDSLLFSPSRVLESEKTLMSGESTSPSVCDPVRLFASVQPIFRSISNSPSSISTCEQLEACPMCNAKSPRSPKIEYGN